MRWFEFWFLVIMLSAILGLFAWFASISHAGCPDNDYVIFVEEGAGLPT